jgi:Ca2+-transporting ATPase
MRGNAPLLLVVLGSFALQLFVVYSPLGNRLMHTQPLDPSAFGLAFAAAAAIVLGVEAEKARTRRRLGDITATTSPTR